MKFRYYVTDLFDGKIKGTNDEDTAKSLSGCEDYFIVDTQDGVWLNVDGPLDIESFEEVQS